MPLAVVGSNVVVEVNGRKVRGRQYPWGVAEGTIMTSMTVIRTVSLLQNLGGGPVVLMKHNYTSLKI